MGKSSKAKQPVVEYRLSAHMGICHGPVDSLDGIYVGEKDILAQQTASQSLQTVNNPDLFGGVKKEGGVAGLLYFLPGKKDQVMPEELAAKFGRSSANMPAYRGLASIFFTGLSNGFAGFLWSANTPYLKDVWAKVTRVFRGWNPGRAAISESNAARRSVWLGIDNSGSMAGDRIATARLSVNSFLTDIKSAISTSGLDIDIEVAFWDNDVTSSSYLSASASDIDELIDFVNTSHSTGSTDFSVAADSAKDWFEATKADTTIQRRVMVFVTDGEPTPGTDDAAAATLSDILDQNSGQFSFANSSEVYCHGINIILPTTSATAKLDNTPEDGIPIVTDQNPNALSDAIIGSVFPVFPGSDMNPAHIILECLTDQVWGMGASLNQLDLETFERSADTLFIEALGLSLMWSQQATIEDFVGEILNHIEGTLFVNPRTGLFELRLIRPDYDVDTLTVLDESNCRLVDHQIKLWTDTVNEVKVTWTNPINEQEETVSLQDPGNIAIQGQIVSDSRNYYGVRRASLALALCERDLRAASAPLSSATVRVDRSLWEITPGSVVRLNFPKKGIVDKIMRVGPVDYGDSKSADLGLSLAEDVFATPEIEFAAPPSSEWVDPSENPTPLAYSEVTTLPYFLQQQLIDESTLAALEFPEVYATVLGAQPGMDTASFEIFTDTTDSLGNVFPASVGSSSTFSHAFLGRELEPEAHTVLASEHLKELTQGEGPTLSGWVVIGTGLDEDQEIAIISDITDPNITLLRGALDTTPKRWPPDTPMWIFPASTVTPDPTVRSAAEEVTYRLLSVTSNGVLPFDQAPELTEAINARPYLPSRPANVTVGGTAFGAVDLLGVSPIPVTWDNRNRLTEDSQILAWDAGDTAGEVGQTTRIVVLDSVGNVLATVSGLTGTSHDLDPSLFSGVGSATIRVEAERDGLVSLQGHEIDVVLDYGYGNGYGYGYGNGTTLTPTGYGRNYGGNYGES